MVQVIPAILATTPDQFKENLAKISSTPSLKGGVLHLDFMDGEFVQNRSIILEDLKDIEIKFNKEAHLMVNKPLGWIEQLKNLGFQRVIFHLESEDDTNEVTEKIKNLGMEVGIAINPETPVAKLAPFMSKINKVQLMLIHPGFQGQPILAETLEKIAEVKKLKTENGYNFTIAVDGHVNSDDVKKIVKKGAEHLVSGSYLLKGDIDENLEKIWQTLQT